MLDKILKTFGLKPKHTLESTLKELNSCFELPCELENRGFKIVTDKSLLDCDFGNMNYFRVSNEGEPNLLLSLKNNRKYYSLMINSVPPQEELKYSSKKLDQVGVVEVVDFYLNDILK